MNAFFGCIQLENATDLLDKSKDYMNTVFASFPSRFPNKHIIENKNILFSENFESTTSENDEQSNASELFFNGEIYNKQEIQNLLGVYYTKNNASLVYELILRKGLKAVQLINGIFFIIYIDRPQQKIYLLNDQMGIRQCYYYQGKNVLLFGSEIKFLLAHPDCPKEIDWETSLKRPSSSAGLSAFKSYKTWFKNISLFPEASKMCVDIEKQEIKTITYWNHFERTHYDYSNDKRTPLIVMEEYIHLLDDAIKIRKDSTSVGSLLSGGLDSSAIAALCAKHSPLETFSILTQITYLEDTTGICRNLASDLNIKNAQFLIPMHKIVFNTDLWKQWIWRIESPENHTDSLTKTLLHYAIRKNNPHIKSVLTGTGSDQLNGGLVRWIVNETGNAEEDWENFYHAIQDAEDQKLINRNDGALWDARNFVHREYLASIAHKKIEHNSWMFYVNSALHFETFGLLWDELRASNYHGHETRFPFLDFRFVDFIAKIPPIIEKELFFDKPILRGPLKNMLPDYVLNKPKLPPYIPEYDYRPRLFNFLTSNMDLMEQALGNIDQSHPIINKPALIKSIKKLQEKPNIIEWNTIIHILNIGLLEKMVGKTEKDMDIESLIEEPIHVSFDDPKKTKVFLESKLSIRNRKIDLQKPLCFCENCFLLFDKLKNKFFLSKDNKLVFEMEDEYVNWKNFLLKIDNKKTTQQLLDELAIAYNEIKEYLEIAIEEKVLSVE